MSLPAAAPVDSLPAAAPAKNRHQWMDTARGLGVLLIVLVHAGSFYSDIMREELPQLVRVLDLAFSPYRIPMLVFLSGIFLSHSLRKGVLKFASGKLRNVLWPYLVWTAIISFTQSGPGAWLEWKTWVFGGVALWFLWFLMVFYAVGLLTARAPFLLVAAYALAAAILLPAETKYGSRLFLLMSYFFVGAFVGQYMDKMLAAVTSRWTLALMPLVIGLSIYFTTQLPTVKYSPYAAPLVLACIVGVCAFVNVFKGPIASALQFAGRNSLKYYVIHPAVYFIVYKWILIDQDVGIAIAMPLAFGAAVGLATIIAKASARVTWLDYLFEAPPVAMGRWASALANMGDRIFLPTRFKPKVGETG